MCSERSIHLTCCPRLLTKPLLDCSTMNYMCTCLSMEKADELWTSAGQKTPSEFWLHYWVPAECPFPTECYWGMRKSIILALQQIIYNNILNCYINTVLILRRTNRRAYKINAISVASGTASQAGEPPSSSGSLVDLMARHVRAILGQHFWSNDKEEEAKHRHFTLLELLITVCVPE